MNTWVELYEASLNSNGFHNIKLYLDSKTGCLVKLSDVYSNKINKIHVRPYYHMGYKHRLNDNLWMFGLFTTKPLTIFNEFTIINIELSNNVFKYVNPPIFIKNDMLCEYIEIIDNLSKFPEYTKEIVSYHKTPKEGLEFIAKQAEKAFECSLYTSNFNDPITLIDVNYAYEYNKTDKMILNNQLKYDRDAEYLRYYSVKYEHINKITNEVFFKKEKLFSINHIEY
jgi:hypothetical protein